MARLQARVLLEVCLHQIICTDMVIYGQNIDARKRAYNGQQSSINDYCMLKLLQYDADEYIVAMLYNLNVLGGLAEKPPFCP